MATFTMGQLTQASGVGVETVRYYVRCKLIKQPTRPNNGFRRYPAELADRIRFIKRNQSLGFTLKEIGMFLNLIDGTGLDGRVAGRVLDQKISQVEEKIAAFQETLAILHAVRKDLNDCHEKCTVINMSDCLRLPIEDNII